MKKLVRKGKATSVILALIVIGKVLSVSRVLVQFCRKVMFEDENLLFH